MLHTGPDHGLADRVASVSWYHSLPLPGGIITPGSFDTLGELARLPFPTSLEGRRCLDVATADGFWAFEMERRGAAEVVAIDVDPERLDWPKNAVRQAPSGRTATASPGFSVAHGALRSNVQWRDLSAYELSPDVVGKFDFIFIGSVLGHLSDPVAALSAARDVLDGELLSVDAVSAPLTLRHPKRPVAQFDAPGWPLWWVPNLAAYRRLFVAAGLRVGCQGRPFFVKRGPAYSAAYGTASDADRSAHPGRLRRAATARLGNLHAWVQATTP